MRNRDFGPVNRIPLPTCKEIAIKTTPRRVGSPIPAWAAMAAALMLSACAGDSHLSFLDPQGPIAALQRKHFIEMVALLAIFVALPIFILIPWLALRYRYGAKTARYTPKWGGSRFIEIAAWAGPIVIVAFLALLVWRSTPLLDPYRPLPSSRAPLRLQVIGYDWKWLFIYPDQGVASMGVLALPAGRPVSIEITSATVMQSLYIPALGSQIYAMGGMVSRLHLQADAPGRFMGENTMYNGDGFHQEKFTAVAMTPQAFDEWVRHAQSGGIPLDAQALGLISRPTTFTQLETALNQNTSSEGSLYFRNASPDVFSKVVMATMSGAGGQPGTAINTVSHEQAKDMSMSSPMEPKP
ncbi:MAG: ubiquinol oxidase subunit II [Janthinobacterium lividum]